MSKLCASDQFFAGLNPACKKLLETLKSLLPTKPTTTMTLAEAETNTKWKALMATTLEAINWPITGYESSQDDPTVQTSQNGAKRRTQEFPPALKGWLDVNMCDFRSIGVTGSGTYKGFYLPLNDGNIMGWEYEGELRPFTGTLYVNNKGFAPFDQIDQFNEVEIYFDNLDQFKNFKVIKPAFNTQLTFLENTPTGYDISLVSQSGADVVMKVELRCDEGVTGFVAADFEITDTTQTGLSISSVSDDGDGVYTITLSDLLSGSVDIRLKKIVSTFVTDVSTIQKAAA